jgi:hypothetical protein
MLTDKDADLGGIPPSVATMRNVNGEVHYALNPSQNMDILERFYIDAAGDLLLTTPLVDKTQEDYTISVIAFDLGQPSLRTFINICYRSHL